jgi:hypothetical protein
MLHTGVTPPQVESVTHGSHFPVLAPVVMQRPARHWPPIVQVPSPRAMPHLLSAVSHIPETHTEAPTAALQTPLKAGA